MTDLVFFLLQFLNLDLPMESHSHCHLLLVLLMFLIIMLDIVMLFLNVFFHQIIYPDNSSLALHTQYVQYHAKLQFFYQNVKPVGIVPSVIVISILLKKVIFHIFFASWFTSSFTSSLNTFVP